MLKAIASLFGGGDKSEFDDIVLDFRKVYDRLDALVDRKEALATEETEKADAAMNAAAVARDSAARARAAQAKFGDLIGEPA